ncbi:MAG: hypothetical protein ACJAR6_001065 [Oleispira sp.]|jgi:hypothetical protein
MAEELNADYVIVGSGAIGMAFADTILTESDATIIIIDRYAKPGGHWNVAYPFVQLHQPSSFYGVSSKELSSGRVEQEGLNAGLGELASGAAVSAYFDDVMRHQFLPSGRVKYFPMCDYQGDGKFVSKVSGKQYHATANGKTVDATYLKTSVPKTHTPNFEIGDGVRFMPLNDLPTVTSAPDGYVVVGAGKTGIDACLWLLEQHVEPSMITWVVSREAWLLDRQNAQMMEEFFFDTIGSRANMLESIVHAESPDDMFKRLEQCGYFLRIDESTTPEMFHAATVSKLEIEQLRRIENVVRLGHLTAISTTEMKFEKGALPTTANTLYIDCSASAIVDRGGKPVFDGDLITPQFVRPYQPVFSASLIAHVELNFQSEEDKNRLCGVVPLPNSDIDFIHFTAAAFMNQYQWSQDDKLQQWMSGNRLDGPGTLLKTIAKDDIEKWAVIDRIKKNSPLAAVKLSEFQAALRK